jgi:hypothetical protein
MAVQSPTQRRNKPPTSIDATFDTTKENMSSQVRVGAEGSNHIKNDIMSTKGKPLTALQHILFRDPDNDAIIWLSGSWGSMAVASKGQGCCRSSRLELRFHGMGNDMVIIAKRWQNLEGRLEGSL